LKKRKEQLDKQVASAVDDALDMANRMIQNQQSASLKQLSAVRKESNQKNKAMTDRMVSHHEKRKKTSLKSHEKMK